MNSIHDRISSRRPDAFTLIELLVVLAIIGLLAGLLVPAVSHTLGSGKAAGCGSNAKQLATAMITFDGDNQQLPWYNEGSYKGTVDTTAMTTNQNFIGTNWCNKLYYYKYLPGNFDKGVWLCPGAVRSEVYGKDTSGNLANYGGYGLCFNIFRQENTLNSSGGLANNNIAQRPLKLKSIPKPTQMWMVGDCGRPTQNSKPGSGYYQRTANGFNRPSSLGNWDFSKAYTDSQPALRHNGEAVYAAFDTHVSKFNWEGMQVETNDFTGRYAGSY